MMMINEQQQQPSLVAAVGRPPSLFTLILFFGNDVPVPAPFSSLCSPSTTGVTVGVVVGGVVVVVCDVVVDDAIDYLKLK
jgi:hypothetical protein